MIDIKKHSLYRSMEFENVFSSIFNIYFKNFWVLFAISFISIFTLQMIFYYLGFSEIAKISDPEEIFQYVMELRTELLVGSIAYVILYGFLISVLVNYILRTDIEKDLSIGDLIIESMNKYMVHMIFFLILSVLITITGAVIGVFALFIGFFVALFYLGTVLMPGGELLVAENKNAVETIGRTFTLTHKDFWSSLGIFVVFIIMMLVISFLMSAIISIPIVIAFFDNYQQTGSLLDAFNIQNYNLGLWTVVINSLVTSLIYPIYAIISVVMYFRLKFVEDNKAIQN